MKYSMVMSTAFAALTLMVAAKADVLPELEPSSLPNTHEECLTWAGANVDGNNAQNDLCDALANCEINESDNEGSLRECIGEAKNQYHQSLAGFKSAPGTGAPYFGEELPISTQSESSDYEVRDGEKGWNNAREGN